MTTSPRKPKSRGQQALVIGISDYTAPIPKLPAVAADVREMAKILRSRNGAFPNSGVTVLSDKQATRKKVMTALRSVFARASAGETVFVYMAGHGTVEGREYFYIPYDADASHLKRSGVPLTEIKALFDATKSRRVFLWLDFCHSGGILARGAISNDLSIIRREIGALGGHGKVIVAACTSNQYAYEASTLGHGLFTHALLRGLKGEAKSIHGEVTAPSLYEFIARQVNYPNQQPVFFGEMSGLIVLMHYPERAAAKATPAKPKVASPQSKDQLNSNRTWVMLGDHFFRADKVRHSSNGTLHLSVTTGSGEDQATFASLRPDRYGGRSSLPFASGNDAHLVRVQSVDSESSGTQQVWTLTLTVEENGFGNSVLEMTYNMDGKTYTPDDMARLRAGRILLNDPSPSDGRNRWYGTEDSVSMFLEGSGRYPVKECVIRSVFAGFGKNRDWKEFARLKAVFALKASGTVNHVVELKIGAVKVGCVPVSFVGRRKDAYGRGDSTIEINGMCPLR